MSHPRRTVGHPRVTISHSGVRAAETMPERMAYSRSASGYIVVRRVAIVTRPGGVLLGPDHAKNSVFASEIGRFGLGLDEGLGIGSRGLPAR